jgi:hypothetical protein
LHHCCVVPSRANGKRYLLQYNGNKIGIPGIDILRGREDLLGARHLPGQELLQIQKLLACDLIFEVCKPALVEGINLELEELSLLVLEAGYPLVLVKGRGRRLDSGRRRAIGGRGYNLWSAKEGRDACISAASLDLFAGVDARGRFTLEGRGHGLGVCTLYACWRNNGSSFVWSRCGQTAATSDCGERASERVCARA